MADGDAGLRHVVRRVLMGDDGALDDIERLAPESVAEAGGPASFLLSLSRASELSDEEQQVFRQVITSSRRPTSQQQRWFSEALGRAFDAATPEVPPGPPAAGPAATPRPRRDRRQILGTSVTRLSEILGLVLGIPVLIGVIVNFVASEGEGVRVLTGDLNVAVAQFATEDGEDVVGIDDLSQTFSDQLADELDRRAGEPADDGSVLSVEVLPSVETGLLDVEPSEALLSDGQSMAEDSHADVVLTAAVSDDRREVTPYLFISPEALPDALELTGVHQLGSPIEVRSPLDENLAARGTIRSELTRRSAAISELLVGLHRFGNGQYPEARTRFEHALELIPEEIDQGVVLLFLGNTALKEDDLNAARTYYERGLAIETGVDARLTLGLAETRFHEVRGNCSQASSSVAALRGVVDGYEEAISIGEPAAGSLFAARTQFGLARAEVCLSSMGEDLWEDAASRYVGVIEDHSDGPDGARDLVAESFAGLGLIASRHERIWDEDICRDSEQCYAVAAAVAVDDERVETFTSLAAERRDDRGA